MSLSPLHGASALLRLSGLSIICRESSNANQLIPLHMKSSSSAHIVHGESVKCTQTSPYHNPKVETCSLRVVDCPSMPFALRLELSKSKCEWMIDSFNSPSILLYSNLFALTNLSTSSATAAALSCVRAGATPVTLFT
ncbi:uncharacterized protein IAS62_005987 [Cryptococcus decagattii]|uniref:Uncharacterized protein n=1 Tax=Cryptococcus decagattii TaxID=1859122 RepID=A0ABZ2B2H4_9TREE